VIEADESLPVIEADESEPVKIEEKDNEVSIAEKVANKIFSGMVREYKKYLDSGSEDDKGVNAFFKQMKKADIKPGRINREGRNIKRWMKSIQKWHKDIEKLDRQEIKNKMSDNLFDSIVKIHTAEDWSKTGIIRDITGDMFKQYLLIRRLKKLEK
ncbi:MAG: hypothetical protein R3321_08195, partial [Nitrososphaeraceae archaeon]|nr:hypothetical protein [Nitrososphaeraceae archaeon]